VVTYQTVKTHNSGDIPNSKKHITVVTYQTVKNT